MIERLDADIKAALLAGQKDKARALSFIKSSLLTYQKELGSALSEEQANVVLRKEVKKRIEAAELFDRGGKSEEAQKERSEAELINTYLPPQLDEQTITAKIKEIINSQNIPLEQSSMGRLIGLAKQEFGSSADASVIAKIISQIIREK